MKKTSAELQKTSWSGFWSSTRKIQHKQPISSARPVFRIRFRKLEPPLHTTFWSVDQHFHPTPTAITNKVQYGRFIINNRDLKINIYSSNPYINKKVIEITNLLLQGSVHTKLFCYWFSIRTEFLKVFRRSSFLRLLMCPKMPCTPDYIDKTLVKQKYDWKFPDNLLLIYSATIKKI